MTTLVAFVLALLSTGLKDVHKKNEAIYNKKAILGAVAQPAGLDMSVITPEQVLEIFDSKVTQTVIDYSGNPWTKEEVESKGYIGGQAENVDMAKEIKKAVKDRIFPAYTFDNHGKSIHILTVRGKGLWDEIWGNIAISDDLNTVVGVAFDHKGETPGLGAEIKDNAEFYNQFAGKKLFTDAGEYVSIDVVKGGAKNKFHDVDGISGATITADGVADMMYKGLNLYRPYLKTIKK
jgi:Na+-transporting NADH:ubiquinone oxidoreductase subunit C